jgi:putative spermidine/putrescine transport system permease protein
MKRTIQIAAALVGLFVALPTLIVVPLGFNAAETLQFPPERFGFVHFASFVNDPRWMRVVGNSFVIGAATALVTTALIIPAAYGLERYRSRGKALALALLMAPLIIPHIVSAVGYFRFFGEFRLLGTHAAVVLAHTCVAIPPALLVMMAVIRGYPQNLDRAAMMCGAGPLRTFFLVAFPILRPGIIVASIFAFLQSFDETVLALFIAGRTASTLPKHIFESLRTELSPIIPVVSTTLIVFAVLAFALVLSLRRNEQRPA